MIEYFIEQGSSYAGDIDALILLITVLVGFWFFLSEVVFFYLIMKYRRKPGVKADYITGEEHEYARFVHWPHWLIIFCDVFIICGAVHVWYDVKQDLPQANDRPRDRPAVGLDLRPSRAPTTRSTPPTTSRRSTSCTSGARTRSTTTSSKSRDVLHNFSVPVFRLKQDSIPGRVITGWFEPTVTGEHDIQCAEICGIGHGLMPARIHIESAAAARGLGQRELTRDDGGRNRLWRIARRGRGRNGSGNPRSAPSTHTTIQSSRSGASTSSRPITR